jgi:hypothetical protein
MTIEQMRKALRCSSCGSRETSIRIVYTAAGGFTYASTPPADLRRHFVRGAQFSDLPIQSIDLAFRREPIHQFMAGDKASTFGFVVRNLPDPLVAILPEQGS